MPNIPAENLKIQVTEVSRYEVFGESGWRGSIRLVELVSNFKLSYLKTLPGPNIENKKHNEIKKMTNIALTPISICWGYHILLDAFIKNARNNQ